MSAVCVAGEELALNRAGEIACNGDAVLGRPLVGACNDEDEEVTAPVEVCVTVAFVEEVDE